MIKNLFLFEDPMELALIVVFIVASVVMVKKEMSKQ